ncbi:hypothetical protein GIB67_032010, partial [Kingdonia uniflora]
LYQIFRKTCVFVKCNCIIAKNGNLKLLYIETKGGNLKYTKHGWHPHLTDLYLCYSSFSFSSEPATAG